MSKTFTYTRITSEYYLDYTDEWEQDGVDFDYVVSDEDLLPKVVELVLEDYFSVPPQDEQSAKEKMSDFIRDCDLLDSLVERYQDDLKEIFRDVALSWFDYER